ncbi:glycoside hydrolase family 88 protein [Cytidiella melzeri]|nr:glycoside hydrolase family 88 protein [Cytidiella melzeri]
MLLTLLLPLSIASATLAANLQLPSELFSPLVAQKILATANTTQNPPEYPQYTDRIRGIWQYFSPDTWTSGFFPATLYALHDRLSICPTDDLKATDWLSLAQRWSASEVPLETKTGVGHDVGFLSFPFVDELSVHPDNQTAVTAVNNFASELAVRFNPIVGCTRSWDTSDPTDFQVIIDNMMNLEVLFQSANLTGNHTLIDIATSHADKTMVNHIRPDGSSFHVVDYNSTTGAVISRHTSQGYADNSTWSRGQAWGIFGFANMFKHTQNISYLETSRKMASYFLTNLPDDGISALGELSLQPANKTGSDFYIDSAIQIIANMTALAWRPEWQSLLANGTVNNPVLNNLTGIVYGHRRCAGDYYFVKNANDLVTLGIATCNGTLTGTTPSSPSPSVSSSTPTSTNTLTASTGGAKQAMQMKTSAVILGAATFLFGLAL